MMDRTQVIVLITLTIAVIASFPTARTSKKRELIYGGLLAEALHHLGVIAYIAVLPAALLGALFVGPFRFGIPFALSCLALALLFFAGYAFIERPARAGIVIQDRGWTEEDARSSGL